MILYNYIELILIECLLCVGLFSESFTILTTILWSRHYFYSYFKDVVTEAQIGNLLDIVEFENGTDYICIQVLWLQRHDLYLKFFYIYYYYYYVGFKTDIYCFIVLEDRRLNVSNQGVKRFGSFWGLWQKDLFHVSLLDIFSLCLFTSSSLSWQFQCPNSPF